MSTIRHLGPYLGDGTRRTILTVHVSVLHVVGGPLMGAESHHSHEVHVCKTSVLDKPLSPCVDLGLTPDVGDKTSTLGPSPRSTFRSSPVQESLEGSGHGEA